MVNELSDSREVISRILDYYELSKKKREKIEGIAKKEFGKVIDFNQIYRRLAGLVDAYVPVIDNKFMEKDFIRLDHQEYDDSTTPFTGDDLIYTIKEETYEEPTEQIPASDFLDRLLPYLSGNALKVAEQLWFRKDAVIYTSEEKILRQIPKIQDRLEALAENNHGILIPRRPIVYIKLEPPEIGFGKRTFKGDPLSFFMNHFQYKWIKKRVEAERFDPSLTKSLRYFKQLEIAIPNKTPFGLNTQLSKRKVNKIIKMHNEGTSKRKIAIILKTGMGTINKYLKIHKKQQAEKQRIKMGLEQMRKDAIECLKICSVNRTRECYGYHESVLKRWRKKEGITEQLDGRRRAEYT